MEMNLLRFWLNRLWNFRIWYTRYSATCLVRYNFLHNHSTNEIINCNSRYVCSDGSCESQFYYTKCDDSDLVYSRLSLFSRESDDVNRFSHLIQLLCVLMAAGRIECCGYFWLHNVKKLSVWEIVEII